MNSTNVADISGKIFALLEPLESPERQRIIQATLLLLNESVLTGSGPVGSRPPKTPGGAPSTATNLHNSPGVADYFAEKDPSNKVEDLAVAARYREQHTNASTHSKENLKSAIKDARRNFDDKNFQRDLNNARAKGLFNKGADSNGEFTLAYYGQKYVDSLPDRALIKTLRKPKSAIRKAVTKTKTTKKEKA